MSRDALAALAGVPRDDALIVALGEFNLVEWLDDEKVRLLQPTVVRAGAAAVALGLDAKTVISLFPLLSANLREIADAFVSGVATEIFQPFVDAGMPEDDWPRILQSIESLLPVASQATLGIFRSQLSEAIDREIGQQLGEPGRLRPVRRRARRLGRQPAPGASGREGAPGAGWVGAVRRRARAAAGPSGRCWLRRRPTGRRPRRREPSRRRIGLVPRARGARRARRRRSP